MNKRFEYYLFTPTWKYAFSIKSFDLNKSSGLQPRGLKVDTPDSIKTFCTEGFKIVRDHNEFTVNEGQKGEVSMENNPT